MSANRIEHASVLLLDVLIELCRDAQVAYMRAAEIAVSSQMRRALDARSRQREQFVGALEPFERLNIGLDGLRLHECFDLKGILSQRDFVAVLNACYLGELAAEERYTEALRRPLPASLHAILTAQREDIRAAIAMLRGLMVKAGA